MRNWPAMEGGTKGPWIQGIVKKEQAVLRMQRREAANKVVKTKRKAKATTKATKVKSFSLGTASFWEPL